MVDPGSRLKLISPRLLLHDFQRGLSDVSCSVMTMEKSEKIELRVTPAFKARVIAAAGDVPVSRWVERAIEQRLEAPEGPPGLRASDVGVTSEMLEPIREAMASRKYVKPFNPIPKKSK